MSIWFSSDFHFGHTNIAGPKVSKWKEGFRDFEHVHDMNKCLTQTINKYVKREDTLYFLGDLCFGGHINTPTYRHSLQCQTIHALKGNHDHRLDHYAGLFASVGYIHWGHIGEHEFFLSHYAHRVWPGSHKGVIHLYGHSHDSIPDYGKSMDVGVDVAYRMFGEYRPFSLEEIVEIMRKKEVSFPDHHNKETNIR